MSTSEVVCAGDLGLFSVAREQHGRSRLSPSPGSGSMCFQPVGVATVGRAPGFHHGPAAMSLVLDNDQFAISPGAVQPPGDNRRTADVTTTVDQRGRNAVQALHLIKDRWSQEPIMSPVVGDQDREDMSLNVDIPARIPMEFINVTSGRDRACLIDT